MAHIVWRDEYSVNVSRIDAQHQNLASLVNGLNEAFEQGAALGVLKKKLLELVTSTQIHFDTEEELMRSNDYPRYSEHKMEHNALISYLEDTENRLLMGKKFNFHTYFNVSCDCFINHMNGNDKELGVFLNDRDIY